MAAEDKVLGESASTREVHNAAPEQDLDNTVNYSVFTKTEKWIIVAMASNAAWFSTLSSFIYYPAIPALSESLNESVGRINLTVTTYMAIASIAPALVGDTADILGRRPVYILTLSLYFVANIAIALTKSYASLLGLRVLQALAVSGTFSIAYGVVTDVASPAERGSFAALVSFAITIAPSLGPILGGALTFAAGWPWIFWCLCIASGACLLIMALFLPETSRKLVGNGSISPPKYLRTPFPTVMKHWGPDDSGTSSVHWRLPNPFKSILILCRKDNAIIILACGLLYVVYTCINASLSTLFVSIYHLNPWEAGLIYLPFGIGGIVSTFMSGKMLDRAWRDARLAQGLSTDKAIGDNLDKFPVEKARLRVIWTPMVLTAALVFAFGWVVHYHKVHIEPKSCSRGVRPVPLTILKHIAIPLVLQFLAGICMQLDFSVYNTLLVDKNHQSPAAAQAASNILRGTLAAITVSFVQNMIDRLGIGWTFTFMGGLCVVATGLFAIDYCQGFSWRRVHVSDSR